MKTVMKITTIIIIATICKVSTITTTRTTRGVLSLILISKRQERANLVKVKIITLITIENRKY